MAFSQSNFASIGAYSTDTPRVYAYKSNDALSDVLQSTYFYEKRFQLEDGDIILCQLSDGFYQLEITEDGQSADIPVSVATPSNIVVINKEEDFPEAVGGIITLEDNKHYILGADVSTANRFVLGANNRFSWGELSPTLTYTGTGAMFTGTDVSCEFDSCRLSSPNASQTWSITDVTPNVNVAVIRSVTVVSTPKIGTFTNLRGEVFSLLDSPDCDDGISISGAGGSVLSVDKTLLVSTSTSFVGVDLSTSVFPTIEIANLVVVAPSGAVGVSGAANSANLPAGVLGQIINCEFLGGCSALSGITRTDVRWMLADNTGIADSTKVVDTYLTVSRTVTITVAGTFYPVNGSDWTSDLAERFTVDSAGLITYISERDDNFLILGTATVEKLGGGSDEVAIRIAINGTAAAKTENSTQNNNPTSVPCNGIFRLTNGDTVQLYVTNVDNAVNVVVSRANLNIINGF